MNGASQLRTDLSEVLRFFDLGGLAGYSRAGGFANENYFVSTGTEEYVVKLLRERDAASARSEAPYLARVIEHGFPAVRYVSANGQCVFEAEDFAAVVMPRLRGKTPERTPSNCASLAAALARLHSIPHDGLEQRPSFLSSKFIERSIAQLDALVPADDLKPYLEAQAGLADFEASLGTKAPAIIHCDFTPNNCLFQDDRLVGVVDWEEVTLGFPPLDVANLVLSTCFSESKFEPDLFKAITEAYLIEAGEDSLHIDQLGLALRLAGLCFSLWVYLRWGVASEDPFITNSRQLYWRYGLEGLLRTS